MNPNYPPQPQDYMAEATEAAARMTQEQVNMDAMNAARAMNAQAADRAQSGANVYGASRASENLEPVAFADVKAAQALGTVTGAAVVKGPNAYVDEAQRGRIVDQVKAQHDQQANVYDQFLRDLTKDDDKVDASK